jgi:hypothetical protein
MKYVLYEMIYTKGLTTTPMCFHETNVSRESIKDYRNQTTNASKTRSKEYHHSLVKKIILTIKECQMSKDLGVLSTV